MLWPLKMRVQISEGEGFLFLGHLIAHSLTAITGMRNAVNFFIHESNFDCLKRKLKEYKRGSRKKGAGNIEGERAKNLRLRGEEEKGEVKRLTASKVREMRRREGKERQKERQEKKAAILRRKKERREKEKLRMM